MLPFLIGFGLIGVIYLVLAVVQPKGLFARAFPVPAIFVFLPERWVMPAGRVFVALCCFATTAFMAYRFYVAPY